jgi:hypothetical protein
MLFAGFIGDHKKDTLPVRIGWELTRAVQSGEFKQVTHTEAILEGSDYTSCTIASASLRDREGVRVREKIKLTPGNWIILDVPDFQAEVSRSWFNQYLGYPYDLIGAAATKLWFLRPISRMFKWFFCNEACFAPFVAFSDEYTPSESFDLAVSKYNGKIVTSAFFKVESETLALNRE